jgi:hypothetical protein
VSIVCKLLSLALTPRPPPIPAAAPQGFASLLPVRLGCRTQTLFRLKCCSQLVPPPRGRKPCPKSGLPALLGPLPARLGCRKQPCAQITVVGFLCSFHLLLIPPPTRAPRSSGCSYHASLSHQLPARLGCHKQSCAHHCRPVCVLLSAAP